MNDVYLKGIVPNKMKKKDIEGFLQHARQYAIQGSVDLYLLAEKIKEVLDCAMRIGDYNGIVEAYQVLALIHMNHHDNEMAANALALSETFVRKFRMPEEAMLEIYSTYVIFYQDHCGDLDAAAKTCHQGMALSEQLNSESMGMKFSAALGNVHIAQGDFIAAEEKIAACLGYCQQQKDEQGMLHSHANLGQVYMGLKRYEEAFWQYDIAMSKAMEQGAWDVIEKSALGMARILRREERPLEGIRKLEDSLRHLQENCHQGFSGELINELVALYIEGGDMLMADVWMKAYEEDSSGEGRFSGDQRYYELKAQIAVGFGDYKSAYELDRIHHQLYREAADNREKQVVSNIKAHQLDKTMERLQAISTIGRSFTVEENPKETISKLYGALKDLMPTDCIGIGTITGNQVDYLYYMADMDEGLAYKVPVEAGDTLGSWCISRKKELMINDISAEGDLYISKIRRVIDRTEGKVTQSIIYIPIMIETQVVGLLTVQSYETLAYREEDLETLKAVGAYLAVRFQKNRMVSG